MEFCVYIYTWDRDHDHNDIIQLVQNVLYSIVTPQYRPVLAQELCANEMTISPRSTAGNQSAE